MKDKVFQVILFCGAFAILLLLAGILYSLISGSMEAFKEFGFIDFIISSEWDPKDGAERYGAYSFILGTLLTGVLSLLICIPFSLSLTLFICEFYKGKRIANWLSTIMDFLSGIPSIIFGIWGLYILRPLFESLNIGYHGYGIFLTSTVLAIMIIPYATSLSSAFMSKIPMSLKENAYSLGATRLEVINKVCLPVSRKGIIASYLLAFGKVLGEAIVVTILIGNSNFISTEIFSTDILSSTGNTLTSVLINQFGAGSNLKLSALVAIALILFIISAIINRIARSMVRRAQV